MKISKETIEILANFSTINPSILILEGSLQKTITSMRTGYAEAVVAETFPKEFALFDLSTFLGILSLFKEPDIDFTTTEVIISEGTHKATYRYCNPTMISHPPKDKTIDAGEPIFSFELSAEQLKLILKAVNLYSHDAIAVQADGENIYLKTINPKEKDSDSMSYNIGTTDQKFRYVILVENLKLLPHSYDVSVTNKSKIIFSSKNMVLKYFVPCDAKSEG